MESAWNQVWNSLDSWAAAPILAGIAFVETVFPPFPGDVLYIVAGGAVLSAGWSPWLVWVPGLLGCGLGTVLLDAVGRGSGPEWLGSVLTGGARGAGKLERARAMLARHGRWALFFSRFVPGIRSVLVVAASWSGMGRASVLAPSLLSAMLWYILLSLLSMALGINSTAASAFMAAYGRTVMAVLAVLVLGALLYRRWSGRGRG